MDYVYTFNGPFVFMQQSLYILCFNEETESASFIDIVLVSMVTDDTPWRL